MLHELNRGVYKVGQRHTDFIFNKHCKWISRLEDEMERERETTKEHINKDAVFILSDVGERFKQERIGYTLWDIDDPHGSRTKALYIDIINLTSFRAFYLITFFVFNTTKSGNKGTM
jgi:hypothetical protein